MALTVVEQAESRPIQNNDGKYTGSRVFIVYDDASPLTTPADVSNVLGTGGLPYFLDQHPDASIPLLATGHSLRRLSGHIDTWEVTWNYSEMAVTPVQNLLPNDVGYVDISGESRAEFVDTWRVLTDSQIAALVAGAAYPNGTPASSFNDDIGGTPIDVAGEPVSRLVRMSEVQLSVVTSAPFGFGSLEFYVGRRNSVEFFGGAVGTVLFLGASQRRIDFNKWSIGLRFLRDQQYHMRQAPKVNPDGSPMLASYVNGGIHADDVYFVQPYPELANFFSLAPELAVIA